jgi:hypothetical protein
MPAKIIWRAKSGHHEIPRQNLGEMQTSEDNTFPSKTWGISRPNPKESHHALYGYGEILLE